MKTKPNGLWPSVLNQVPALRLVLIGCLALALFQTYSLWGGLLDDFQSLSGWNKGGVLEVIRQNRLREFIAGLAAALQQEIARHEEARRPFAAGTPVPANRGIDRRVSRLLMYLSLSAADLDDMLHGSAGVLMSKMRSCLVSST